MQAQEAGAGSERHGAAAARVQHWVTLLMTLARA